MKVKCTKIINEHTGKKEKESWALTIGKIYTVLSVHSYDNKSILIRILSDDGKTPVLSDLEQFEVVSGKIPPHWRFFKEDNFSFSIGPKDWVKNNFWEDFFDEDPDAIKLYKSEINKTLEFEAED